jgi:hypothetical protein
MVELAFLTLPTLPEIPGTKRPKAAQFLQKTRSRSAIGIFARHFRHTYFGVFEGPYIFSPQRPQKVYPAKTWTAFLDRGIGRSVAGVRISRHACQSSSETTGSHGDPRPNRSRVSRSRGL